MAAIILFYSFPYIFQHGCPNMALRIILFLKSLKIHGSQQNMHVTNKIRGIFLVYVTQTLTDQNGDRDTSPSQSNFFYFHAVFSKISCQIIDFCPKLSSWRPLGNPGSATAVKLPMTKPHSP